MIFVLQDSEVKTVEFYFVKTLGIGIYLKNSSAASEHFPGSIEDFCEEKQLTRCRHQSKKPAGGCFSCGCCVWDGENYVHSWDMYWNAKSKQVTVESEAYMVGSFYSRWNTPSDDQHSGEGGFTPEYVLYIQYKLGPHTSFFMRLKTVIFTLLFRGIGFAIYNWWIHKITGWQLWSADRFQPLLDLAETPTPNSQGFLSRACLKEKLGGSVISDIFYFHPVLFGKMNPIWRAYFSNGLKPPIRKVFGFVLVIFLFDPSYHGIS